MPIKKRFFLLFLLIAGIFFAYKNPEVFPLDKSNETNSYEYLKGNIKKIYERYGAYKTATRVQAAFKGGNIDINECHSVMHLLGHYAYESRKENFETLASGISTYCMSGFMHGVEAQISLELMDNQKSMSEDLKKYCTEVRKQNGDVICYHGLGHAIIQTTKNLMVSLKTCDTVALEDDPSDCYRGVFSEYVNLLKGIDGDTDAPIPGVTPVKIEKADTFDTCLTLPTKYQDDCVSQFTSFIYEGDMDQALDICQTFKGWVGKRCAKTSAGNYTFANLATLKKIPLPKYYVLYSWEVKTGYIEGVIEGYTGFIGTPIYGNLEEWCSGLPNSADREYCLKNI